MWVYQESVPNALTAPSGALPAAQPAAAPRDTAPFRKESASPSGTLSGPGRDGCPGAAKAAVFPGAATQHLVHRKGGGAPGGEQLVAAVVVVQVHQLGHLLGGSFQLLVGDAHFLHNIVDRLDPELFRADEAVALRRAHVGGRRYKNDCRSLLASSTHHHILKYPF